VPDDIPTINTLDDVGDVTITETASGQFLKWNGSAWVNDAIDLGTDTTGNYVSDVTAGTGVSVTHTPGEGSSPTIAIGQSVATNANPSFAGATLDAVQIGITAAGEIDTTAGDLTIDSAGGTVTVDDNLTVTGNLTVSGTTTTINTETLTVDDNIIVLNNNATGAPSENAGIEVERGSSANVQLRWNETSDKWEFTDDGTNFYEIASVNYVDQNVISSLDDIGDVTITSASTGEFLKWSGSAWVNDAIDLGTDTTGSYVQSLVAGTGITLTNNSGEGATPTIAVTSNTFEAHGAVASHEADTTNIHGITDTSVLVTLAGAQTLTNKTLTSPTITGVSPVITLAGDLTGSVTLTNLGNGTLTATVAANSVALGTDTTGDYVQNLTAGMGITLSNNSGEGATPTIAADTSVLATLTGTQTLTNKTLTSPSLTGTPTAPTATSSTSSTQIATTAFAATLQRDSLIRFYMEVI
jgi:hypothetical protein